MKEFVKKYYIIIVSLVFLIIIGGIVLYQETQNEAKRYCGNSDVIRIYKQLAKRAAERSLKYYTHFSFSNEAKKLRITMQNFKKYGRLDNFKILKKSDDNKHFLCQTTVHNIDENGFETHSIIKYFVKYYTRDGKNWVYVKLAN